MKVLIQIPSVIGIVWFALPVFTGLILNVGNITGISVFVLLFLSAEYYETILSWPFLIRIGLIVLGSFLLVSGAVISTRMIHADTIKPTEHDTVVILGCSVFGKTPSLMLRQRMDAGLKYLKEHPDAAAVLSGGKGPGEDISEAEAMEIYLQDHGIASERLYREDQSTTTQENLVNSRKIIEENGLSMSIAVATNEFHEYRAQMIARKQGMEFHALPAASPWWTLPTYFVREMYAVVREWIFR
jgi:uncharacterized SAM-binding protein YcdF (DUF218 family)